jgi:prepilin-type N-terminal cleavage/methylation domain-containing protein
VLRAPGKNCFECKRKKGDIPPFFVSFNLKEGITMLTSIRANPSGFTLIELMVVIAIIGILAAIAIPNFISYRNKAYCGEAEHDAQNTLAALSAYFSEPERTQLPGLAELGTLEQLSLNNATASVALAEAGGVITVTVNDDSGRCPRAAIFTATMGGAEGQW